MTRRAQGMLVGVLTTAAFVGVFSAPTASAQEQGARDLDKIPKTVMDVLEARFPNAEIRKWTREEEDDLVLYDIEFVQDGRRFEADILDDGRIHNWEREVAAEDLPPTVTATVTSRYPRSALKQIMAVTVVDEGTEALEGYEIVLETADGKEVEVLVAPDGTILEEGAP